MNLQTFLNMCYAIETYEKHYEARLHVMSDWKKWSFLKWKDFVILQQGKRPHVNIYQPLLFLNYLVQL